MPTFPMMVIRNFDWEGTVSTDQYEGKKEELQALHILARGQLPKTCTELDLRILVDTGAHHNVIREGLIPPFMRQKLRHGVQLGGTHETWDMIHEEVCLKLSMSVQGDVDVWETPTAFLIADLGTLPCDAVVSYRWLRERNVRIHPKSHLLAIGPLTKTDISTNLFHSPGYVFKGREGMVIPGSLAPYRRISSVIGYARGNGLTERGALALGKMNEAQFNFMQTLEESGGRNKEEGEGVRQSLPCKAPPEEPEPRAEHPGALDQGDNGKARPSTASLWLNWFYKGADYRMSGSRLREIKQLGVEVDSVLETLADKGPVTQSDMPVDPPSPL